MVGVCCTLIRKQRMNPPARAPRTQQSTPHRGRSCRSKPWTWRMSSALSIRAPAKVSFWRARQQGKAGKARRRQTCGVSTKKPEAHVPPRRVGEDHTRLKIPWRRAVLPPLPWLSRAFVSLFVPPREEEDAGRRPAMMIDGIFGERFSNHLVIPSRDLAR